MYLIYTYKNFLPLDILKTFSFKHVIYQLSISKAGPEVNFDGKIIGNIEFFLKKK